MVQLVSEKDTDESLVERSGGRRSTRDKTGNRAGVVAPSKVAMRSRRPSGAHPGESDYALNSPSDNLLKCLSELTTEIVLVIT